MEPLSDSAIHWLLAAAIPSGGAFFVFLLKRTFKEFETNITKLFTQMEASMKQQTEHDKKIDLLEQRLESLEDNFNGRKRRRPR